MIICVTNLSELAHQRQADGTLVGLASAEVRSMPKKAVLMLASPQYLLSCYHPGG